ncbi:unnamed protein product [marine sediment metagenome]|uniref:Uncharacterized protein n=1 Tax=marine sediment metagenome TaxID=412755 RepID=X1T8L0_9ZZZZ
MAFIDRGHFVDIERPKALPIEKMENPLPPPPGPEWEGIVVTCNEVKTEVLLCILNSVGGYEWIKLGEST